MTLTRRLVRFPISLAIAVLSVLTFALQIAHDPIDTLFGRLTQFDLQYAFIPLFASEEPWRWLTGPFLHIAPWHLLNNVGFVLILGSWLEEDIGSIRLAALFAVGALAGEAFYLVAGQELDVILGISAGLMAIAGAAIVTERHASFAAQRQRLAGLTIAATVLLSIGAPALGALGAHVTGAVVGVALGLILPPPLRIRARQAGEMENAAAAWLEAKATVEPAPAAAAVFHLQPTRARTIATAVTAVLLVVTGLSIGLQSVFISDTTSATVAVVAGVWTVGIGILLWMRIRVASVRFDLSGMSGGRWRRAIGWSEVESLYPGRVFSGLFAMGAIGFIRRDGKRFAILGAGHQVRPLARQIEAIRLAALRTAEKPGDSG
jgi:membrane associated rhomboid family serine protease